MKPSGEARRVAEEIASDAWTDISGRVRSWSVTAQEKDRVKPNMVTEIIAEHFQEAIETYGEKRAREALQMASDYIRDQSLPDAYSEPCLESFAD